MLSGVKVIEICGIGPGPFCAMHLADLGANVIAVERPQPADPTRAAPEGYVLNRGKRSVVADLKTAEGRELVLKLVESADALIEGMRPGVMERLGLGPDSCHARNPRLVYGRMTGWGQAGPMANAAGHDNNYISLSGALYYNGTAAEPPSSAITVVGDIGGGALYLAVGILSGVLRAREVGMGTVVDAAIVDGSAHMLQLLLSTRRKGFITGQRGRNIHDSSHFYSTYRCADGAFITVGAIEPQFYALLLDKLGLAGDSRFAVQWERERWPELQCFLAPVPVMNGVRCWRTPMSASARFSVRKKPRGIRITLREAPISSAMVISRQLLRRALTAKQCCPAISLAADSIRRRSSRHCKTATTPSCGALPAEPGQHGGPP